MIPAQTASCASLHPDPSMGNTHVHSTHPPGHSTDHKGSGYPDGTYQSHTHPGSTWQNGSSLPDPSPHGSLHCPDNGPVSRFLIKYHHLTLTSSCFLSFFYFLQIQLFLKSSRAFTPKKRQPESILLHERGIVKTSLLSKPFIEAGLRYPTAISNASWAITQSVSRTVTLSCITSEK